MAASVAQAQSAPPDTSPASRFSLAVTFDAATANLTTSNQFWFTGGAAAVNAAFFHGFGATASVTGLRTANSGGGVPVNLVAATFGPSYTLHPRRSRASLFVRGLVGEVNGFSGVYPSRPAPGTSANGLAAQAGGGVDLRLAPRMSVRLVEVHWLRTQLPNATTNVQNDLLLGAGIVFH